MIPRATLYSSVIAAFALAAPAWGSQQTATPAAPPASDQIAACGQAQPIVRAMGHI